MARQALLIGVERFSDGKIRPVLYADNDATRLGEALSGIGFTTHVLVNHRATKAAIESKLHKIVERLTKDDTFFLFIASHGFCENSRNHILCHDTQTDDLARTSLALQPIFELLRQSNCKRSVMFLDACEVGVDLDEYMRGHLGELSDERIREHSEQAEYCVGFAACKSDEKSHASPRLKHGVWTYCLIQALSGNAKEAIDASRMVTSATLQSYLGQAVQRELQLDHKGPSISQTPWQFGGLSRDFAVADLTSVLAAQRPPPVIAVRRSFPLGDGREVDYTLPEGGMTIEQCVRFFMHLMTMSVR